MPERFEKILKIACACLGALLIFQMAGLARVSDPFKDLTLPSPPAPPKISAPPADSKPKPSQPPNRPPQPGAVKMDDLPPAVQARVEKIRTSEILGPVPRPLPMALLGIAGNDVIIRAPNGQTGLVREGDQLGGLKVLKIGTNRVLVEHEGQTNELSIFSGFGSDSLLKSNP